MKEQYIGDVNDYRKYALLRGLTAGTDLRLGVYWMLTCPDGRHDGNKLGYLEEPARWRPYDPDVFDVLRVATRSPDSRRLATIEQSGLFPRARFFNAPIADDLNSRRGNFQKAHEELAACDLVFFDPDNGLDVRSVRKGHRNTSKYLYADEAGAFWTGGSSVLFYQHHPYENHDTFTARIADRLTQFLPGSHVVAFRTTHVAFFLASQPIHLGAFKEAMSAMTARWPASFIRSEEHCASATANHLSTDPAHDASTAKDYPSIGPELRSEALAVMARGKIDDVCEARRPSGTAWEVLGIEEALAQRKLTSMRCIECKGEVRPHRGARNGVFRPHFEHRVRHEGCSRCSRARGAQTAHPSPAH